MHNFSQRLKKAMADRALTQSDLARMLRTTQATVSRWLNGTTPRGRNMDDLLVALSIDRRWLLEGIEPTESVLREEPGPRIKVERFPNQYMQWDEERQKLIEDYLEKIRREMMYAAMVEPDYEEGHKEMAFYHLEEFYEQIPELRTRKPKSTVSFREKL